MTPIVVAVITQIGAVLAATVAAVQASRARRDSNTAAMRTAERLTRLETQFEHLHEALH